jgi:hypothetical protein
VPAAARERGTVLEDVELAAFLLGRPVDHDRDAVSDCP